MTPNFFRPSIDRDVRDAAVHSLADYIVENEADQRTLLHQGYVFGEHVPFFFTRTGASLPLSGMYRGATAFLLAGGPSVKDLDLSLLKNCFVMTLNNAVTAFRGNASCVVDHPSRFNMSLWLDPKIMKFLPARLMEGKLWDNRLVGGRQRWQPTGIRAGDCPNVIGYRTNQRINVERWLHEDTVNWGNGKGWGGGRSVMLASLRILFMLGFRRVYLLGVDFEMNEESKYHFVQDRHRGAINGNTRSYMLMQTWFQRLQPKFLEAKFIVQNCNSRSKLRAFPCCSFEGAVNDATSYLGDPRLERTEGMYQELEPKSKGVSVDLEELDRYGPDGNAGLEDRKTEVQEDKSIEDA